MKKSIYVLVFALSVCLVSCASKRNVVENESGDLVWRKGYFQIHLRDDYSIYDQRSNNFMIIGKRSNVIAHVAHSDGTISYDDFIKKMNDKKNKDGSVLRINETTVSDKRALRIREKTNFNNQEMMADSLFYSGKEGTIYISALHSEHADPSTLAQINKFLQGFSILETEK